MIDDALPDALSIVRGARLEDEPGLGPLTIAGYLREVTDRHADLEALVMHLPSGERVSWTYRELWARSVEVAQALIAAGVDKGTRVGVLMTNRPEYLSSVFGIALAGGVTAALSTFSTPSELEHLLRASGVAVLLYDRRVLKTDFGAMLCELEPRIRTSAPGTLRSTPFPFLRHLVELDAVTPGSSPAADSGGAVERWPAFLARGKAIGAELVEARSESIRPADAGALFFSSGTTSVQKAILHAQRAFTIHIIKTGGANVSPEEVDAAIVTYPGVRRSQTVGVPHSTLSEMVVACIVPIDGVTLNEENLVGHLKQRLASFKLPRKVLFFDETDFALTGNEKVKVNELRQLAAKRLGIASEVGE